MPPPRYVRSLAWIAGAAVAVRVLAVLVLRAWEDPGAMEHAWIAQHLVSGRGFSFGDFGYFGPTSIQSPTYPLLLALLFAMFGAGSTAAYVAALLLNCLLAAPAAVGVALATKEMGGRPQESLLAAALFAVWPTQIYAVTYAQAVVLITACVAWMIGLFLRALRRGGRGSWLGYSLVASLASLTEPTLLPITALSGLWMLLARGLPLPVRLRNAAILAGVGALMLGPWTLRNLWVHDAFVPVKSGFWVNVWKGANDYATGTDRFRMPDERREALEGELFALDDQGLRGGRADHQHQYDALRPEQMRELAGKSEVEREKIFRRYATEWIRAHPERFAELSASRFVKSVWIDWDNPKSHHWVYVASRAAILLLSVPGLVLAASRGWRLVYPLALVASCLAVYTFTLTAARFAIPLETVQLALAAGLLGWLAEQVLPAAWPARVG
jgi:hypothetical protein